VAKRGRKIEIALEVEVFSFIHNQILSSLKVKEIRASILIFIAALLSDRTTV